MGKTETGLYEELLGIANQIGMQKALKLQRNVEMGCDPDVRDRKAYVVEGVKIMFDRMSRDNNRKVAFVNRFKDRKVLVLGQPSLDVDVFSLARGLANEEPYPIFKRESANCIVPNFGAASNTMLCFKRLGANVWPVGLIGTDKDDGSRTLLDLLDKHSITSVGLIRDDNRKVHQYERIKARTLATHASHRTMFRLDTEDQRDLTQEQEKRLIDAIDDIVTSQGVEAISVPDYGRGLTKRVYEHVREHGKRGIYLAGDPRYNFSWFEGFDFVTPNDSELYRAITGNEAKAHLPMSELTELGKQAIKKYGLKGLAITMGGRGALIYHKGKFEHVPPKEVVESPRIMGAGDVWHAAATCALLSEADAITAAEIGHYAARSTLNTFEVYAPTSEEVIKTILQHEKPTIS